MPTMMRVPVRLMKASGWNCNLSGAKPVAMLQAFLPWLAVPPPERQWSNRHCTLGKVGLSPISPAVQMSHSPSCADLFLNATMTS